MKLEEINSILDDLYVNHPSLKPFLGTDYGNKTIPKIMLVLESHFLATEDKEAINNYDFDITTDNLRKRQPITDWYELGQVGFEKKYDIVHKEYYHTSDIIDSIIEVVKKVDIDTLVCRRGHKNSLIPIQALCSIEKQPLRGSSFSKSLEDRNDEIISIFDSCCIVNYFYRPFFMPTNNLSPSKEERLNAKNRLAEVILTVNPEIIIVCTSYAHDAVDDITSFDNFEATTVVHCKHPSSRTREWKKVGTASKKLVSFYKSK